MDDSNPFGAGGWFAVLFPFREEGEGGVRDSLAGETHADVHWLENPIGRCYSI